MFPEEEFWPPKKHKYSYDSSHINECADSVNNSSITYDILSACLRQKSFYYQVYLKLYSQQTWLCVIQWCNNDHMKCQILFIVSQVSLPHYRDEAFLKKSIVRYKKFLYLKSMHRDKFIVPCYDIDVVWHTHQVRYMYFVFTLVTLLYSRTKVTSSLAVKI